MKQLDVRGVAATDILAKKQDLKQGDSTKKTLFALGLVFPPAMVLVGGMAAVDASNAINDNKIVREQMLYYALNKVYLEELDSFMKL